MAKMSQFRLLMWKNWVLTKRKPCGSCCGLLITPLFFVAVLVIVRNLETLKDTFITPQPVESFCTVPLSATDSPSENYEMYPANYRTYHGIVDARSVDGCDTAATCELPTDKGYNWATPAADAEGRCFGALFKGDYWKRPEYYGMRTIAFAPDTAEVRGMAQRVSEQLHLAGVEMCDNATSVDALGKVDSLGKAGYKTTYGSSTTDDGCAGDVGPSSCLDDDASRGITNGQES